MAKQKANRKAPAWWEMMKGTICELYATNTLRTVIDYLWNEHGVKVTKRQLVYRLDIWGRKKYNTGEEGFAGPPVTNDDGYESIDDSIPHSEFECARSHATHDGIGRHQSQTPVIIEAANTQLAVCDGEGAFNICAKLNNDDLHRLTAISRSAETEEQCRLAINSLEHCIFFQSTSNDWPFYCLLYVYVCDSMKECLDDSVIGHVINAVISILDKGDGFLFKGNGSLDMVAYMLLDNLDLNHRELFLDRADVHRLQALLEKFESWDETKDPSPQEDIPTPLRILQQCLAWCHRELFKVSCDANSANRPDVDAHPTPDQVLWKNHIEVFGTLWHNLTIEGTSTGIWPEWVNISVDILNLPHAEVLSYVCWLIVQSAARLRSALDDHSGYESEVDPVVNLFLSARMAAHELFHSSHNGMNLWHELRDTFLRFNRATVADTEKNKIFAAIIAREFEMFVKKTLDIGHDENVNFSRFLL